MSLLYGTTVAMRDMSLTAVMRATKLRRSPLVTCTRSPGMKGFTPSLSSSSPMCWICSASSRMKDD